MSRSALAAVAALMSRMMSGRAARIEGKRPKLKPIRHVAGVTHEIGRRFRIGGSKRHGHVAKMIARRRRRNEIAKENRRRNR